MVGSGNEVCVWVGGLSGKCAADQERAERHTAMCACKGEARELWSLRARLPGLTLRAFVHCDLNCLHERTRGIQVRASRGRRWRPRPRQRGRPPFAQRMGAAARLRRPCAHLAPGRLLLLAGKPSILLRAAPLVPERVRVVAQRLGLDADSVERGATRCGAVDGVDRRPLRIAELPPHGLEPLVAARSSRALTPASTPRLAPHVHHPSRAPRPPGRGRAPPAVWPAHATPRSLARSRSRAFSAVPASQFHIWWCVSSSCLVGRNERVAHVTCGTRRISIWVGGERWGGDR